jgi:hypothetical protein
MPPLGFVDWLRGELTRAGIRYALTSGQACVRYGLQQTTKDSDWIIDLTDLVQFRELLAHWDSAEAWQVSYRSICGAPLEKAFLCHGWTSHLCIVERDGQIEHHMDVFGKPPRVQHLDFEAGDAGLAARHVVAQMKKTDREKDWPFVFGIGRQMLERGDWRGVLHLQDAEWLVNAWTEVPGELRSDLIRQRPLLIMIDREPRRLRRALAIERSIWMAANRARYTCYQRAWKGILPTLARCAGDVVAVGRAFPPAACRIGRGLRRIPLAGEPFWRTGASSRVGSGNGRHRRDPGAPTLVELDEVAPPAEIVLP